MDIRLDLYSDKEDFFASIAKKKRRNRKETPQRVDELHYQAKRQKEIEAIETSH